MTGAKKAEIVIAHLKANGWIDDGQTQSDTVLVSTKGSPRFGRTGGELRTFGGRRRLKLGDTDQRVTVGPRKVAFYRLAEPGKTADLVTFQTGQLPQIVAEAHRRRGLA